MNKRSTQWLQRMSLFGLTIILMASMVIGGVQNVSAASLIVDDDFDDTTPGWGVTAFASIQDAVDVAAVDDTIEVKAGTYTEQVSIDKNLTLFTTEGAVIQAFPSMVEDCTSPLLPDNHPIVCVKDTSAVTVQGFTIDGLSLGDSNVRLIGIAYRNAGGTVDGNTVQNIRFDGILKSDNEGVGIYLYNSDVVARTINILDNTITNFNKNGITVTTHGAWDPITFNIQGNTITGIPNSTVAQNGIQVFVPLGSGVIQGNIISNIAFNNSANPNPLLAASILNQYTPVETLNNVITGAQLGIYYLDGSGRIQANDISIIKPGTLANPGKNVYGILAGDRGNHTISPIDPPEAEVTLMDVSLNALQILKIDNNIVLYTGDLPNTNTYGIEADAGFDVNDLSVEIHHNRIGDVGQGFDKGIALYQCETGVDEGCDTGLFSYLRVWSNNILGNNTGLYLGGAVPEGSLKTFIYNRIVGNTVGAENAAPIEFWVKNNWWGCNAGPNMTGCDTTLSSDSGTIVADKWLVLTTSVDPTHVLQGAASTITADLRYNSTGVIPYTDNVPNTVPVAFSVKSLGSVLPTTAFYTAGLAEAVYTAPLEYGAFEVCATTDNQEVCSTVTVPDPLDLSDLDLLQSTNEIDWSPVEGTLADGFTMYLAPIIPWYYLDADNLVVNRPLGDGMYPFYIVSHPTDYFDYWAGRGVVDGAEGWQGTMYEIISGNLPIFYLKVDGADVMLVDGLLYAESGNSLIEPLRINGDYLPGDYTFGGDVEDEHGFADAVSVDITFVSLNNTVFLPLIQR